MVFNSLGGGHTHTRTHTRTHTHAHTHTYRRFHENNFKKPGTRRPARAWFNNDTIGYLSKILLEKVTISAYLEHVALFFTANGIGEDKQVPALLTAIGGETYALLLLAPEKPSTKSFAELKAALQWHFDLKPLVIAEHFYFHFRCQQSDESIAEYVYC